MFQLRSTILFVLLFLMNCKTDVKTTSSGQKSNDSVDDKKSQSIISDIIPRITEYADYESAASERIRPGLSDTMINNSSNVDMISIKKKNRGSKINQRENIRKKTETANNYRWISEKPTNREEAYKWAYSAYKLSLVEEQAIASEFIDRALELYENGSLWTEKAKHSYNAGEYEKTIIYCDASLRRNDHWNSEDRKLARLLKYKACDTLALKYPSKLAEKAASKAFVEFSNE